MNTYTIIDKSTWPRAELFDAFTTFANPCLNITVPVEGQNLYVYAKDTRQSFFMVALFAILRAANAVPQCRQRVLGDNIVEFDRIAIMTPIMTHAELFQQIWCEYSPTLQEFSAECRPKVVAAQQGTAASLGPHGEDFLCASCNPWMHFSAVSQADMYFGQAVPILAWGKLKNGLIPVACKFSHAFMDGLHVGRFFTHLENSFTHPESLEQPIVL